MSTGLFSIIRFRIRNSPLDPDVFSLPWKTVSLVRTHQIRAEAMWVLIRVNDQQWRRWSFIFSAIWMCYSYPILGSHFRQIHWSIKSSSLEGVSLVFLFRLLFHSPFSIRVFQVVRFFSVFVFIWFWSVSSSVLKSTYLNWLVVARACCRFLSRHTSWRVKETSTVRASPYY